MAVAHSAASESHAATTGSVSQTSFTWTHTQTGTPQGVLVFVHVANSTGNPVSSVTYGSVTLTRVSGGAAIDSAGEAGRTDLFFAGSGLSTGNQTITVNRANTTDIMYASAATVTALTDTNVTGIVLLEGDGALAVQSVTDGGAPTNSLRYAAAYSGLAAPPPAGTGSTLLNSIDFGNYGIALVRETTAGTGARNVGFNNATTDDRAAVHVAVRELWNRTDTQTVGAFTLTGNDATLTKAAAPKVMDGGTGVFTLSGQPADLRRNPDIEAGTGAFTLAGQPADARHNVRIEGGTGAFAFTGNDATLTEAAASKVLTADTGTFAFTGNPASTTVAVRLAGDVGKFFLPERNIARWSEQFENGYWTKTNFGSALAPVVTANNAIAPDGTLTAEQVVFDTNGSAVTGDRSVLEASTNVVTGRTYIFSVWLKTTDGSTITLQLSHANASPRYATVTPTWQRFASFANTAFDAIRYARLALRVGTITSAYASLHVWGFQWEEGTSITDYDPTGAAGATDAALRQQYKLTAEVGVFAHTGQPATLAKGRTITAETGAFTTAGQPATLRHNPRIEANTGSFALSGGSPALLRGRYLSGGAGEFIETGQPATFRRTWTVQAATGAFSFIGNAATLSALRAVQLTATATVFTVSGNAVTLRTSHLLSATFGSFALTGNNANLSDTDELFPATGIYVLTGYAAALSKTRRRNVLIF